MNAFTARVIAAAGLATAVTTAVAISPAHAIETDRGYLTSSVYLSRSETREVARHLDIDSAGGAGARTAVLAGCARLAVMNWMVGAACATSAAVYGTAFINATKTSIRKDRCLRIRYTNAQTPVIVGFYDSNNGKYCED